MTRVELLFRLTRPLEETLMKRISDAHTIYGIQHVRLSGSLREVTVGYDASRLTADEVEAALLRAGIPAEREGNNGDDNG